MRKTKRVMLLAFVIMISAMSCNSEELFIEPVGEEVINLEDEEDVVEEDADTGVDASLPCDFDLNSIEPNATLLINCIMDLDGATINLPPNVSILYEGGDIINGTLNFSDNAIISGELLNSSLTLSGAIPQLKEPMFQFDPQRWDIVEGKVTDEIALINKTILQTLIDQTKLMGAQTFSMDKMDAYFLVGLTHSNQGGLSQDSIHLPSNFNLFMTDNSYLRVQPNHYPWSTLLSTYNVDNVVIKGGNLVGDRYTHDYSDYLDWHGISRGSHEWPGLLVTAGCSNILIEGINLKHSTGDGFIAGAAGHRTKPETKWNRNITVQNCIIDGNRRNNISITDGEDIKIINNTITNAGSGITNRDENGAVIYDSNGVEPKYGIDVEPYITYSSFNIESQTRYEWVENVVIEGNSFTQNVNGSIIVFTGDNVLINNNFSDHTIALGKTQNSDITNNTIVGDGKWGRAAISTGDFRLYVDFVGGQLKQHAINNNVNNNVIEGGFSKGLSINGSEAKVSGNIVKNVDLALQVDRGEAIEIYDNKYISNNPNSGGIMITSYANNVNIHDEEVDVQARSLFINGLNRDTKYSANVRSFVSNISNCILNGGKASRIYDAVGLHLNNNTITTGTEIINSDGIHFKGNSVTPQNDNGVYFDNSINSVITGNTFTLSNSNYQNVKIVNNPVDGNNVID